MLKSAKVLRAFLLKTRASCKAIKKKERERNLFKRKLEKNVRKGKFFNWSSLDFFFQ